jgi:hypothetical protein
MRKRYPTRLVIKIYDPDNIKYGGLTYTADRGTCYTTPAIKGILDKIMSDINKNFPTLSYKIVPLPNFQYNFVCTGVRSFANIEKEN